MNRREDVAPEALQRAIRRVVEDYDAFLGRGPAPGTHDDAKAFAAHHAAAKSALAHLEHLLKLARGQGDAAAEQAGIAQAADLLRQARGALAAAPDDEEEGEGDGGPSG
ncbi:hypothetical protein [Teichococcus oryzae]|uniref:Uncharacterized protein n=1 Tax=Teichococcus oryzae TaxID=1608942 RepID=A0A5B2TKU3_9PROT|nr:hypothetical protein [Pseudoroseomonas oryzae]KAA2214360.1 hypothetical protein F0Q34_01090 [Pseudoroseomonas oryzae]